MLGIRARRVLVRFLRIMGALAVLVVLAVVAGWLVLRGAPVRTLPAVPFELKNSVAVVGYPAWVRYLPTDPAHVLEFEAYVLHSNAREAAELKRHGGNGTLPRADYLAISGGGDNGAFGAGYLKGWSESGKRPRFKLVTGVSTGALTAPFAFLGPAYDERLKALYTGITIRDIAERRSLLSALYMDAMEDSTPLRKLVERTVTKDMLDAIAVEHDKGRTLLIATTNLDIRSAVIWNVTEIAATKRPDALALVHKILIASSAIPGTFPPVMIEVENDGEHFEEMHVDGGTASQVFVYPAAIKLQALAMRERALYIIRNARLDPDWAKVDLRTLPIALRSITCLIQNQGLGDLYRIFSIAERDHLDYNLVYIPSTFTTPHKTNFEKRYMGELFDLGEKMGKEGNHWSKRPPTLVSGVDDDSTSVQ